jgi:hypothetical protein
LAVNQQAAVAAFSVARVKLRLNFSSPGRDRDTLTLAGILPVSPGEVAKGTTVLIHLGDLVRDFTLDSKGGTSSRGETLHVKGVKKGRFTARAGQFILTLSNQSLGSAVRTFGLENVTTSEGGLTLSLPVGITLDGTSFVSAPTIRYSAKRDRHGVARNP